MQELKDEIKSITVSKQNSLASMNEQYRYLDTCKSPNNMDNKHNEIDIPNFNSSFNSSSGYNTNANLRNNHESNDGIVDPEIVTEQELMMGMLKEPEERDKYTEDELVTIVCSYEKLVEEINKIDEKLLKLIITNESDQKAKKNLIYNRKLFMK